MRHTDTLVTITANIFTRDSTYGIERICYRPFVRLSVCHTGRSVKNAPKKAPSLQFFESKFHPEILRVPQSGGVG